MKQIHSVLVNNIINGYARLHTEFNHSEDLLVPTEYAIGGLIQPSTEQLSIYSTENRYHNSAINCVMNSVKLTLGFQSLVKINLNTKLFVTLGQSKM